MDLVFNLRVGEIKTAANPKAGGRFGRVLS